MQIILFNKDSGKIICRKNTNNLLDIDLLSDNMPYVISDDRYSTHYINDKFETQVDIEVLKHKLRIKRDDLLNKIDIVNCNAERWATMTDEQKVAWSEYKQELRDFPETCDIENPIWPTPPK